MPLSRWESKRSLRRCRSTASNVSRNEIYESLKVSPEAAHQQALAGAMKALGLTTPQENQSKMSRDDKSQVQSVRFTGSTAVGSLQPRIAGGKPERWTEINTTAPLSPLARSTGSRDNDITALPPIRKISGPFSSFKRLKKSKSVISPRKDAFGYFAHANSSPLAESSFRGTPASGNKKRQRSGLSPSGPPPTAEEVLFQLPNTFQTNYRQEDAIRLARDQYTRQLEEQGLEAPSFSSVNTRRAPPKIFRRTVRGSSAGSVDHTVKSEPSPASVPTPRSTMAGRKISGSIKGKLRRIFRGTSQSSFPAQQVSASRQHYDKAIENTAGQSDVAETPECQPVLNDFRSCSPTLPGFISQCDGDASRSLCGNKSEESLTGSRSTSWGHSTISKDASVDSTGSAKNRLSVIKENTPHQPSSSANRSLGPGYAAFHKPLRPAGLDQRIPAERVVSALKKRIEEQRQLNRSEEETAVTRAKSSMSLRSRCSIRKVPDEAVELPQIKRLKDSSHFDIEANEADDVFQPTRPSRHKRSNAMPSHKLSFQNIANLNEEHRLAKAKAKAQETRATFFPGKRQYPEYRSSALQNAMKATVEDQIAGRDPSQEAPHDSSESVYSRKTTGTPLRRRNLRDEEHGTAYIIDTKPMVTHYQDIVSQAQTRAASDTGSWKEWMALEASKLQVSEEMDKQLSPPWTYRGFGHRREEAQAEEDTTAARKVSGPKQIFGFARKISGARRKGSSHSTKSAESQTDEPQRKKNMPDKQKSVVQGPRVKLDENNRPMMGLEERRAATSLSSRLEPPALWSIEESPLSPFSKFMATDDSPTRSSPLALRPATSLGSKRSAERETRLRRMQSSLPSSGTKAKANAGQYPWLHDYRSLGLRELPCTNVAQPSASAGERPLSRTNRTVDLFLSRQNEGSVSPNEAFI